MQPSEARGVILELLGNHVSLRLTVIRHCPNAPVGITWESNRTVPLDLTRQ